jgi:hypothetical protein
VLAVEAFLAFVSRTELGPTIGITVTSRNGATIVAVLLVVGLTLRQLCRLSVVLGLWFVASCVSSGNEVAGHSLETVPMRSVADVPSSFLTVIRQPLAEDQHLLVVRRSGGAERSERATLLAADGSSPKLLWHTSADFSLAVVARVSRHRLLCLGGTAPIADRLHVVDLATGSCRDLGLRMSRLMSIQEDRVVFAVGEQVGVLDLSEPLRVRLLDVEGLSNLQVVGAALYGTDRGSLTRIDLADGRRRSCGPSLAFTPLSLSVSPGASHCAVVQAGPPGAMAIRGVQEAGSAVLHDQVVLRRVTVFDLRTALVVRELDGLAEVVDDPLGSGSAAVRSLVSWCGPTELIVPAILRGDRAQLHWLEVDVISGRQRAASPRLLPSDAEDRSRGVDAFAVRPEWRPSAAPVERHVSPNGRWAAVVTPVSAWEQRVQLVDIATGSVLAVDVASVAACYWLPAAD